MKNIAKQVLGCIVCWAAVLAVCFGLLCAAAAVPNDSIKDNLNKSAQKLAADDPHGKTAGELYHSVQDNYADAILLGIAANMDSDDVFTSVLDTNYYDDGYGAAVGILATTDGKEANTDYTRYWHGSLVLVRPSLMFTDISGIRIIGAVIIIILLLGNAALLIWKKHIAACVILLVSAVLVQFWFVFTTIEYMAAFIVMLAVLPLYVKFAGNAKALTIISAGVGTLTAFADFLTTETLTILVPLAMAFFITAEKGEKPDTKKALITVARCLAAWGACYLLTFGAKWLLASAVLGRDVSDIAFSAAAERFSGTGDLGLSAFELFFSALGSNFTMLTPCGDKTSAVWALGWIALFAAVCIFILRFDTRKLSAPKAAMITIAALPVVRICVLMNHSYLHNFFTYRALMASIMALLGLVWYRIGGNKKTAVKKKK